MTATGLLNLLLALLGYDRPDIVAYVTILSVLLFICTFYCRASFIEFLSCAAPNKRRTPKYGSRKGLKNKLTAFVLKRRIFPGIASTVLVYLLAASSLTVLKENNIIYTSSNQHGASPFYPLFLLQKAAACSHSLSSEINTNAEISKTLDIARSEATVCLKKYADIQSKLTQRDEWLLPIFGTVCKDGQLLEQNEIYDLIEYIQKTTIKERYTGNLNNIGGLSLIIQEKQWTSFLIKYYVPYLAKTTGGDVLPVFFKYAKHNIEDARYTNLLKTRIKKSLNSLIGSGAGRDFVVLVVCRASPEGTRYSYAKGRCDETKRILRDAWAEVEGLPNAESRIKLVIADDTEYGITAKDVEQKQFKTSQWISELRQQMKPDEKRESDPNTENGKRNIARGYNRTSFIVGIPL